MSTARHTRRGPACEQRPKNGHMRELIELARYTLTSGERVLFARPIQGLLRLTDHPAGGDGDSYLVESALKRDSLAAVNALVEDYLRQAARLDEIPMVARIVPRVTEVELARYSVTGGERILFGQRIGGLIRVTDRPAARPGRSYLVECDLARDGFDALAALLADYMDQAARLDDVPMAASAVYRSLMDGVSASREECAKPDHGRWGHDTARGPRAAAWGNGRFTSDSRVAR